MARYEDWKEKYDVVGDVRGLGGMVGIEFVKDRETKAPAAALTAELIQETARRGLLVEGAGIHGNVIRFLAPLVMTDEQLEAGLNIFERAIQKCIGYEAESDDSASA
jgi:4-aminobutyrate aminotransferase/(S)-3-amino-2-methylpropionate transaminase